MSFWDALSGLPPYQIALFAIALLIAFGFEFINGFHDTANAVATVIYTRTLNATTAVIYSGFLNFLGVLLGGTAVAFSIVNLLPVDLLVDAGVSSRSLIMVLSLLVAGVIWNLGTWYFGLPVSSSHTLIGCILGVGLANSYLTGGGGVNWSAAQTVALGLLLSPLVGFIFAGLLLLLMKQFFRDPRLYLPPEGEDKPPSWIRYVLIGTCGGVSFAHGSNDGQKGMGLILLILIGFLPAHYALNTYEPRQARDVFQAVQQLRQEIQPDAQNYQQLESKLKSLETRLRGIESFAELPQNVRWETRQDILQASLLLDEPRFQEQRRILTRSIEFVPLWVVVGVALALGIGTTIGYKRIVITVAEKIGKTHLTYAQGAAAEMVAAATILGADLAHLPVSTTQVVSSGVAGTMAANRSGIQFGTARKILLAWLFTLPCTMAMAALFVIVGIRLFG
jgi:inorganic phosphate transporter, PiT family